jgi:hypothetical protein
MLTPSATSGSWLTGRIRLPAIAAAKVILSGPGLAFALVIAHRKLPSPESAVVVTW